jgi:hypothetical protein
VGITFGLEGSRLVYDAHWCQLPDSCVVTYTLIDDGDRIQRPRCSAGPGSSSTVSGLGDVAGGHDDLHAVLGEHSKDQLGPEHVPVRVDVADAPEWGRSSSAATKTTAHAILKISFAGRILRAHIRLGVAVDLRPTHPCADGLS